MADAYALAGVTVVNTDDEWHALQQQNGTGAPPLVAVWMRRADAYQPLYGVPPLNWCALYGGPNTQRARFAAVNVDGAKAAWAQLQRELTPAQHAAAAVAGAEELPLPTTVFYDGTGQRMESFSGLDVDRTCAAVARITGFQPNGAAEAQPIFPVARAPVPAQHVVLAGQAPEDPYRVDERVTAWLRAGRGHRHFFDDAPPPPAAAPAVVVVHSGDAKPVTVAEGAPQLATAPPPPYSAAAAAPAAEAALSLDGDWKVSPYPRGPRESLDREQHRSSLLTFMMWCYFGGAVVPLFIAISLQFAGTPDSPDYGQYGPLYAAVVTWLCVGTLCLAMLSRAGDKWDARYRARQEQREVAQYGRVLSPPPPPPYPYPQQGVIFSRQMSTARYKAVHALLVFTWVFGLGALLYGALVLADAPAVRPGPRALWAMFVVFWFVSFSYAARMVMDAAVLDERARSVHPRSSTLPRSLNAWLHMYCVPNWALTWWFVSRPCCWAMNRCPGGCGSERERNEACCQLMLICGQLMRNVR